MEYVIPTVAIGEVIKKLSLTRKTTNLDDIILALQAAVPHIIKVNPQSPNWQDIETVPIARPVLILFNDGNRVVATNTNLGLIFPFNPHATPIKWHELPASPRES